jgi:type III pantothenate kinase
MSMPFESDYAKGEAGIDRLANVAAAIELRLNPCIVIDVGTAVTLEAISAQGCFLGGSIFPGPELASAALAGKAKQLPEIELRAPESAVASDTHHGIQAGVIFGIAGAIDRLIDLTIAEKFYTEKPLEAGTTAVMLTGGFAELIAPHLRNGGAIEPNLTLTGVAKIYRSL